MEFVLHIVEMLDGDVPLADPSTLKPELREQLGDALKDHRFVLRAPVTERLRQEAEARMWVPDVLLGVRRAEELRAASYCVTFLASWTLTEPAADGTRKARPLTMEGFAGLHPLLADAIWQQVGPRVMPAYLTEESFTTLLSNRPQGS